MTPTTPSISPSRTAGWVLLARAILLSLILCPAVSLKSGEKLEPFWAFQSPRENPLPPVSSTGWPDNSIDHYILARLEANGLQPAPPASQRDLLRRVTFDLTGLPPTSSDIDAFLTDDAPDAYDRVIDRLLASPRYGEKWSLHWLDVIRYAESEGFEYDRHLPGGWRFRDYVINAFNRDKPYDLFVTEQLAGDELNPDDYESRVAAGFHRLGAVRRNAGNPEIALSRNEVLTERTDIIGSAFLGLTVGCARCHDHKFDPIAQRDYYQLQAYIAGTAEDNVIIAPAAEKIAWENQAKGLNKEIAQLRKAVDEAEGQARVELKMRIDELQKKLPPDLPTIASTRNDKRTPIHILKRGVWEQKGEPVGMRPPSCLVPSDEPALPADVTNPRSRLAQWLTNAQHPLTGRVLVNRLWQYHFGTGIVKTANDFGRNGSRPSHPELLDYLALEFVKGDWRLKPIHRLILQSNAYRQASTSTGSEQAMAVDPNNRLLWQFPRRRLAAEEIRDSMLAVSGRLHFKAGGPSVIPPLDKELIDLLYKPSQWAVTPDRAEHDRRSIYLIAKRNLRLPFMEVFDQPPLQTSCARRSSGTHAPQALELLNGKTSNDLARAFATRLQREAGSDPEAQVKLAFRLAVGRPPLPTEMRLAVDFIADQPLHEFTLALFNLNAFLYVL
jgi:hypothetical protein